MSPLDTVVHAPYASFYVLGFVLVIALAFRAGQRYGLPADQWLAVLAFSATAGIVGSKLLHFDLAAPTPGAKTILGGTLAGGLALFGGMRALRLDRRALDTLAVAFPLGFAAGRIGCLLSGCCFGHVTDLPWGVVYEPGTQPFRAQLAAGVIDAGATASMPVHPTQLYEALLALGVALMVTRGRRLLRAPGTRLLTVLTLLALGRGALELWRARETTVVFGLSSVQWLLLLVAASCTFLIVRAERDARRGDRTRNAPARAPSAARRLALVGGMAAAPLLLLQLSAFFTPLERLVLTGVGAAALFAVVRRMPLVAAPGFVTAALVLLPLQQDTTFPRYYWTFGMSAAAARTAEEREVRTGTGEDCEGQPFAIYAYPKQRVYHRAGGASIRYTRQQSPANSTNLTLRGSIARVQVRPIHDDSGITLPEQTKTVGAFAATHEWNRRRFGLMLGGAVGRFGSDSTSAPLPIGAVRIGNASRVHLSAGLNDLEPAGPRNTTLRAGIGRSLSRTGSGVSIGVFSRADSKLGEFGQVASSTGIYLSGTIVTRAGFEIEPFAVVGDEYDFRIALRKRTGIFQGRP